MDYDESKIKGIIREGLIQNTTTIIHLKTKNPYAIADEQLTLDEMETQVVNKNVTLIYDELKQKGLIK